MVKVDQNTEVYENQIEKLFHQYFEDREIDLEHGTIKQTKFKAAWIYIYNTLFKPDQYTVRLNNRNSKLDYRDIDLLNRIVDIFISLCMEYNIVASLDSFSRLTGITTETLYTWEKGEYRSNIYYTTDGHLIDNIAEYKSNNRGEYIEKPTSAYSDIVKKIRKASQEFYRGNLSDTPVGQITIANNDDEVGLMYAQKEAQAKAEAWGIPQQSREQIASRYAAYKELPGKAGDD